MAITTVSGNVVRDPQLRFTQSGDAVASFTVAHTKRKFDKSTSTWVDDGDTLFVEVTAWKALGEGAAESLRQGSKVIVSGELRQRNWEDKNGNKRVTIGLDASDVGVSVRAAKSAPVQSEDAPW